MRKVNRGKQFENEIKKGFEKVPSTTVLRLYTPQGGQSGVAYPCDFVVYHFPKIFFIECKSRYGNTLSIYSNSPNNKYGDISNTQWEELLKLSCIYGTVAGVMVWFIDHDLTIFLPIKTLQKTREAGYKSINAKRLDQIEGEYFIVPGTKRRVLFDYNLKSFIGGFL